MSKKITIGIDISRANTEHRTGVEEYVFQIAKQIRNQKSEIKNLTDNVRFVLYTREPLIPELAAVVPKDAQVRILRWPPKRLWTQVRLSWEMLVHPPDVLFVPGHVVPLIHPKKTVMTVHDVAAKAFPQSYHWFERWYSLWSARYAMKNLWKIIVPSDCTKNEIQGLVNRQKRAEVHTIPLGYDTAYRQIGDIQKTKDALNRYGIQTPFLLSVGRRELKKNTVRIIQAFEKIKQPHADMQLVLVGGKGHGYDDVREAIDTSEYKKDIIEPGFVKEADLPYIMNAAEVFVFPSLYEGFGIPILEAFACGTPVVTSNTTSCKDVAGDAAVLVDPLDVASIASGIEEAMRGGRVEAGLQRAKTFSWEETVEKIFNVLAE